MAFSNRMRSTEMFSKYSCALMQDVSLVSMRPLVMLLDGGPATFLAQTKAILAQV